MTPNPPSGTPRSWKSKFQAWLLRRTSVGLPPVSAPSPTPLAPQHPFLAQEPVSEANRPGAVAEATRTRQLMDRICAINNANVTRNYGIHIEDLTRNVQPPPLTAKDMADADRLLTTARPLDPPYTPKSLFAEPRRTPEEYALHSRMVADRAGITTSRLGRPERCYRRFDIANYLRTEDERQEYLRQAAAEGMLEHARFDVERSRRAQHPAAFMPSLPSVADVQSQIAAATGYEPPAPDPSPSYDPGGGGDFGGGGASSSWD